MEIEERLRSDQKINEFLQKNQFAEGKIIEAAKQLAKEEDVLESIRKILSPLAEGEINIFFSYNHKDEDTAKKIVGQLRKYSARLNIHYMADNSTRLVGKEWRKWIKEKIAISNWFILLLPDPSVEWDWCLFETGLFERDLTSGDRLICIHHPLIKLPGPIDDYHAVPAKQNEVEQFLKMVFIEENPIPGMKAINPNIDEKDLKETARIIVNAIVPPRRPYRDLFEPWIEFMHDDIDNVHDLNDLDKSRILTINQKALELFDYHVKPENFGTLRRGLPTETDQYWCEELVCIVKKIAVGRNFFPISGVIKANNGKTYKPVLCSIDRLVDQKGPISSIHLIFVEEVGTVDGSAIPQKLLCLGTLLRYAFRFRWEVLEKYSSIVMVENDVIKLQNALLRIKRDWETKGIGGEEYVLQFYPEKEHGNISNMYNAWKELSTLSNDGKLDIAIKNKDVKIIPNLLEKILPINQQFLEMTVHYFSQEVSGSK